MHALTKRSTHPHHANVDTLPLPEPGLGEVRVRTEACGLCGSDVHAWRQDAGYEWVRPPIVFGHEAIGHVEALGKGVAPEWLGKRVVPVSIDGCGECDLCDQDLRQICLDRTVLGLSFDGAAAESFVVPAHRLVEVNTNLPATTLALTEPLSVACRAVRHVERGSDVPLKVVVTGPGPIGIMSAILLTQRGHTVVLCGVIHDEKERLPLARSLGLNTMVNDQDEIPFAPTAWLEASGSSAALETAIETVRPGSTVSVVGLFAHAGSVNLNAVTRKEIRLQGSYGSTKDDYQDALNALMKNPTLWPQLVTEVSLADGAQALEQAASGHNMKIVLIP